MWKNTNETRYCICKQTTGGGFDSPLSQLGFCMWQLAVKRLFLGVWSTRATQEDKLWSQHSRRCDSLHSAASTSHESAPDWTKLSLGNGRLLSGYPPPSFFIPVVLSSFPLFWAISSLPSLLSIPLYHPSPSFPPSIHFPLELWCSLPVFFLRHIKSDILAFLSDAWLCVLFNRVFLLSLPLQCQ